MLSFVQQLKEIKKITTAENAKREQARARYRRKTSTSKEEAKDKRTKFLAERDQAIAIILKLIHDHEYEYELSTAMIARAIAFEQSRTYKLLLFMENRGELVSNIKDRTKYWRAVPDTDEPEL